MAARLLILNGPNLDTLGVREPEIYGRETLDEIEARCRARAEALGADVEFRQSNHEGALIDWIRDARGTRDAIVINPAAYGHTSIALRDALTACGLPVVELHLSNPLAREPFRRRSYVSAVAAGVICGFGGHGYELAVEAAAGLAGGAADGGP